MTVAGTAAELPKRHIGLASPLSPEPITVTSWLPAVLPSLGSNDRTTTAPTTATVAPSVVKCCPSLLTSTVMLASAERSPTAHSIVVELRHTAEPNRPVPTRQASAAVPVKPEPTTVTTLPPSPITTEGRTCSTLGIRSYRYSSPCSLVSTPFTLTSTTASPSSGRAGIMHNTTVLLLGIPSHTAPPFSRMWHIIDRQPSPSPTTVTMLPPCKGPWLGTSFAGTGAATYAYSRPSPRFDPSSVPCACTITASAMLLAGIVHCTLLKLATGQRTVCRPTVHSTEPVPAGHLPSSRTCVPPRTGPTLGDMLIRRTSARYSKVTALSSLTSL